MLSVRSLALFQRANNFPGDLKLDRLRLCGFYKMKKLFFISALLLPEIAFADSTSTIQLPTGFVVDVLSNTTSFLSNFSGYTTLIISVLLGVVVIEILIGAIRKN